MQAWSAVSRSSTGLRGLSHWDRKGMLCPPSPRWGECCHTRNGSEPQSHSRESHNSRIEYQIQQLVTLPGSLQTTVQTPQTEGRLRTFWDPRTRRSLRDCQACHVHRLWGLSLPFLSVDMQTYCLTTGVLSRFTSFTCELCCSHRHLFPPSQA